MTAAVAATRGLGLEALLGDIVPLEDDPLEDEDPPLPGEPGGLAILSRELSELK